MIIEIADECNYATMGYQEYRSMEEMALTLNMRHQGECGNSYWDRDRMSDWELEYSNGRRIQFRGCEVGELRINGYLFVVYTMVGRGFGACFVGGGVEFEEFGNESDSFAKALEWGKHKFEEPAY